MFFVFTPLNLGSNLLQSDSNQNMNPTDYVAQAPHRTIGETRAQRGEEIYPDFPQADRGENQGQSLDSQSRYCKYLQGKLPPLPTLIPPTLIPCLKHDLSV